MEDKSKEFEKAAQKILSEANLKIDYDLMDFGMSLTHTDENWVKRRIEPFSEEWEKAMQLIENQKPNTNGTDIE